MTLGQGLYRLQTSQCTGNSEKELKEYNFDWYTARPRMDPHGHVRKALGLAYAHRYHVKDFWADCKGDKEVRMRHYMHMIMQFLRRVQLFQVPDQLEEDESTLMHPRYLAVANLAIPSIDWDEQEVEDLDTITQPIITRTKEWVDGQVA